MACSPLLPPYTSYYMPNISLFAHLWTHFNDVFILLTFSVPQLHTNIYCTPVYEHEIINTARTVHAPCVLSFFSCRTHSKDDRNNSVFQQDATLIYLQASVMDVLTHFDD